MNTRTRSAAGDKRKNGMDFGRLFFGLVWIAFVSVMAWIFANTSFAPSLRDWEAVPCRIVKSSVKMEKIDEFVFTAEYEYECRGARRASRAVGKPGAVNYQFKRVMSRLPLLEKYAPGTEHECRVDPENPARAFLAVENPCPDPDEMSGRSATMIVSVVLVLFVSVGVFMVLSSFPKIRGLATPQLKKLSQSLFLALFGLPFLAIGTSGLARQLHVRSEAKAYVPVPAKVLYSGVYSSRSGGRHPHTTYGVRVGYEYTVDGKKYESDRLSGAEVTTNNHSRHRDEAARYRKGDAVTAYVSPDDPRTSLLVKPCGLVDIGPLCGMGLFGAVGLAVMSAGLWMAFSLMRGKSAAPRSFENRPLKPSRAALVASGLFAVVWNAFSWSFALAFVSGDQARRLEPAVLLVALFPLVGLFLVGVFLHGLVRELRAPGLALALSCSEWGPGAPAHVDWTLDDPEGVESLEITLEGTRTEGSGKHRYEVVVSSRSCCRHVQPLVPAAGSFGFAAPDADADGCRWRLVAKTTARGARREYSRSYPLPI